MNQPKRHHYIPRWLLADFEPDLNQLDISSGRVIPTSAVNAAVISQFYRFNAHEEDPLAVEKLLAQIESNAKVILEDLVRSPSSIDADAMLELALFLAYSYLRAPAQRAEMKLFDEGLARLYAEMKLQGSAGDDADAGRALQALRSGELTIRSTDARAIAQMVMQAQTLALVIAQMQVHVLESTEEPFVVGDSFATSFDPNGGDGGTALISSASVQTVFPISPQIAILLTPTSSALTWKPSEELVAVFHARKTVTEATFQRVMEAAKMSMTTSVPRNIELEPLDVVNVNYRSLAQAERWVFGAARSVEYLRAASMCNFANVLAYRLRPGGVTILEEVEGVKGRYRSIGGIRINNQRRGGDGGYLYDPVS